MLRKLLIVVIALLPLIIAPTDEIEACTQRPVFYLDALPEMELLVKATVVDVDDVGYNAILRVEEYYKGEGAPLLTVMRFPPALSSGALVRDYDTGCLYTGFGHHWIQGNQGYFGLRANGNGTFTDVYGNWSAHFYPLDGNIFQLKNAMEGQFYSYEEPMDISEVDFIDLMLELGNRTEPIPPIVDTPLFYPLMRFLNVTTENGVRYQVNPDRSISELPADYPIAISPDGAHVAFRIDDETIAIQYIWTALVPYGEYTPGVPAVLYKSGQAIEFSGDSNFAVIWDKRQLTIYMFTNEDSSSRGFRLRMNEIANVPLHNRSNDPLPHIMWSADATTLVWQDGSGIWHWNIYEEAHPKQLRVASELDADANVRSISTYGRYVQVENGENWVLIDSETGEVYENAIAAPTEQLLLFGNGRYVEESCTLPLRSNCRQNVPLNVVTNPFQYQWTLVAGTSCSTEFCLVSVAVWHPSLAHTDFSAPEWAFETRFDSIRELTYDPQYDQPAILVGDYQIYFDFYANPYPYNDSEANLIYADFVDLEGIIDSPIASIEWGQPVFFSAYNMTTFQYLPQ